jgi:hypothetical protein
VTTASALDGAGLLDSLSDLTCSLRDGDWLAAGLAGVSTAIDTVAAALDPFGSLVGAGLGWLMEHLEPLKGWLNDLTGDAGHVEQIASSWGSVGGQLEGAADDLTRLVRADLQLMSGATIDAYTRYTDDLAAHLRGLGDSSGAVGSALAVCSTVVQVVHDLVRDTLAQLVGSIIAWAAEATLSIGLATPWIVSQVVSRVSSLATRVGRSVIDVLSSAKALTGLVEAVDAVLARVTRRLRNPGSQIRPMAIASPRPTLGQHASSAEAAADAALAAGRQRGAAAQLDVAGARLTDVSTGDAPRTNHAAVQDALDAVPRGERARWHGGCAEIGCLNQALEAGVDLTGGAMRAVAIGESNPGHGLPKKACSTCKNVMTQFGVQLG